VLDAQRAVKQAGARKPTALVLYHGAEALHYANLADLTMIDRYSIPWEPLAAFGQHVRMTRLALGKGKPLVAVLQAFDWKYYPELLPGYDNLRPPTYDELRCLAYCALVEGATGMFFYAFDDGTWKIRDHPETWSAVCRVIAEINERRPLFEAGHLWWPWRQALLYQTPGGLNAALDSSVVLALLTVERGNRSVASGYYLLAVNTTDQSLDVKIYLPAPRDGEVRVSSEDRSLPVKENWTQDQFQPYDVHVYGPFL
jgi:hypothetical protein